MTRSMTAFTRREIKTGWGILSWEIRTVNHRFLEIHARLPDDMRVLETAVRQKINHRLNRGKVDCMLRFHPVANAQHTSLTLNKELIKLILTANKEVQDMMADQPAQLGALDILRWPGVIQVVETDLDKLQNEALKLLDDSLDELCINRQREGAKMNEIILQRCDAIRGQVELVKRRLPEIVINQKQKLISRLQDLKAEMDVSRLEQEMVYIAQKIDIAEELDRLEVHIEEVQRVLQQDEPVGRRLDFLMQELNREANTLGSKSVDTESTRASVEVKVLIEQMREQIQNCSAYRYFVNNELKMRGREAADYVETRHCIRFSFQTRLYHLRPCSRPFFVHFCLLAKDGLLPRTQGCKRAAVSIARF